MELSRLTSTMELQRQESTLGSLATEAAASESAELRKVSRVGKTSREVIYPNLDLHDAGYAFDKA